MKQFVILAVVLAIGAGVYFFMRPASAPAETVTEAVATTTDATATGTPVTATTTGY